jgi:hypothetical protein
VEKITIAVNRIQKDMDFSIKKTINRDQVQKVTHNVLSAMNQQIWIRVGLRVENAISAESHQPLDRQ